MITTQTKAGMASTAIHAESSGADGHLKMSSTDFHAKIRSLYDGMNTCSGLLDPIDFQRAMEEIG